MPTERPRHQITETEAVARAIDAAAAVWPGETRSRLAARAIVAGGDALIAQVEISRRLAAIDRIKGRYTDSYPSNYLENLRDDWPE